jgi:hypothetical protein
MTAASAIGHLTTAEQGLHRNLVAYNLQAAYSQCPSSISSKWWLEKVQWTGNCATATLDATGILPPSHTVHRHPFLGPSNKYSPIVGSFSGFSRHCCHKLRQYHYRFHFRYAAGDWDQWA